MRLLWNIVRKDARRVRWTLGLFVALMAGRYLLGLHLLRARELTAAAWGQWTDYDNWLWTAEIVVAYLLAGWIVQEDLLVGTQTFWLTRPISRLRLFGAKLLGVGLLVCVLPAVVALPWWLHCGYGAREVAAAAAETMFWHACLASVAMALASLTDDLARFVLYSFILLLVASTYTMALLALKVKLSQAWLDQWVGLAETRVWICALWVLLTGAITVVHQYLTRRTRSSWVLLVVGLLAIVGPVQWWPWDLSEWAKVKPRALPEIGGISLEYSAAKVMLAAPALEGRAWLLISGREKGVPSSDVLCDIRIEGDWRWHDGVRYVGHTAPSRWPLESYLPMPGDKGWELLGLRREQQWNSAASRAAQEYWHSRFPDKKAPPAGSWGAEASLPPWLGRKMLEQPSAWQARVEADLARPRVAVLVPLHAGTAGGRGAEAFRILNIKRSGSGRVWITASQSWSTAGTPWITYTGMLSYDEANAWGWFVFNDDKTHVAYPRPDGIVAHRIGTVAVVRRQLAVDAPTSWAGHEGPRSLSKPDPEWPGWLDHATFARVVWDRVGRFQQTLQVEQMVAKPWPVRTFKPR